jgi:hypothetical protein
MHISLGFARCLLAASARFRIYLDSSDRKRLALVSCYIYALLGRAGSLQTPRTLSLWRAFWAARERALRESLLAHLTAVDAAATTELVALLCLSTTRGEKPATAFSIDGARSGYFLRMFHRCQNLPNLLLTDALSELRNDVLTRPRCAVASIGGGPGFDAIGLALLRAFCRAPTAFSTVVYDLEMGWASATRALDAHFAAVRCTPGLAHSHICAWAGPHLLTPVLATGPQLRR